MCYREDSFNNPSAENGIQSISGIGQEKSKRLREAMVIVVVMVSLGLIVLELLSNIHDNLNSLLYF